MKRGWINHASDESAVSLGVQDDQGPCSRYNVFSAPTGCTDTGCTCCLQDLDGALFIFLSSIDALFELVAQQSMFRSDFVAYKVIPIGSFDNLTEVNESLIAGNDDVRFVLSL